MTPEFWAITGLAAVLIWQAGDVVRAISIAASERREDHREMMVELERIANDVGTLEMLVGGLDNKINPPDLSDYQ